MRRGAAYRLGGVIDEDVERSGRCDGIRQPDNLGRVAKVDADDSQAVQPLRRVGQTREPADRVPWESCGDGRVGAVAGAVAARCTYRSWRDRRSAGRAFP